MSTLVRNLGRMLTSLIAALFAFGVLASSPLSAETRLYLGASKPGGGFYPTMGMIAALLKGNIPGLVATVGTEGGRANAGLVGTS